MTKTETQAIGLTVERVREIIREVLRLQSIFQVAVISVLATKRFCWGLGSMMVCAQY